MTNPPVETASARRQKTRDRLLDAAYDVFAEVGVDAAPVELIAERAGFTRGAFYSNFESKAELFMALAERENAERIEKVQLGIEAEIPKLSGLMSGTHEEKLEAVTAAVGEFLRLQGDDRHWCLIEGEFRIHALRNPEFGAYFAQYSDMLLARLGDMLVETLKPLGVRFAIEPAAAARIIVATYHSAAERSLMVGNGSSPSDDTELQRTIAAIVTMMTVPLDA
ncbi:TetR/AcrR family transcriptional regulator [Paramicrobacterium agarici]|uniref:TetR family transcriptional regulator n=1 Tax=Paramicrobacterium agarici TaxID=630514 RepID=A0A2A9DUW2_9MICO|nr:TetR/AcrR family transcriptional regulator [Microbacterium agarici]PFG30354.1 TetR family transcriptional regulator [Microbacterium agarici]TQO23367.1 TetR family transcriptional regulator [Microbacterium agarici]